MPRTVQEYRLCQRCAERQGGLAGLPAPVAGAECFICGGLMDKVASAARAAARAVRRYQFDSFAVGISLPEGIQELEDELRANLKVKGEETIKTQAARLIGEEIATKLGKRVDKGRPDLTAVVDIATGGVSITSRPLFLYGRYTKPPGISQRREFCRHCSGRGCEKCRMTGFDRGPSVEEGLRARLAKACGSDRMKFTWIGSEDKDSRVYPPGRPFVVEVKSPVKRDPPRKFVVRSRKGLVSVSRGRVMPSRPTSLPSFRFRTEITARTAKRVADDDLSEVRRRFRRALVRFERPNERPTSKMVYRAQARKRGTAIVIDAVLDGGLPVKRFVSGELVSPSVSEVLKTEVRCRKFDIREVKETGEFGFAKITR